MVIVLILIVSVCLMFQKIAFNNAIKIELYLVIIWVK